MNRYPQIIGKHGRVKLEGILPSTSKTATSSNFYGGSSSSTMLEVFHKDGFQVSHHLVVVFDQLRKLSDSSPNMYGSRRIWHLHAVEDSFDPFIRLMSFRYPCDTECPSVDCVDILWGSEPGFSKPDHVAPEEVDEDNNEDSDEIRDRHMYVEEVPFDVANSHHTQEVSFLGFMLDIVQVVDGNEGAAGQYHYPSEERSHETKETEEGHCIHSDFVEKLGLLGMDERR